VAELIGSDTSVGDAFGESVATLGNTTFVGAPSHTAFAGRAYVFAPWRKLARQAIIRTSRGLPSQAP
jgi:hypothetical protein